MFYPIRSATDPASTAGTPRRASEVLIGVDLQSGRILSWSAKAEGLLGYGEAEAIGRLLEELVPHALAALEQDDFERFQAIGHATEFVSYRRAELKACTRSGQELPVELRLQRVGGGDHGFLLASLRDCSGDRAAAEDLLRNFSFIIAQQEASLDGLIVIDDQQRLLNCNLRFIEMWDVVPQSLEDANSAVILHHLLARLDDRHALSFDFLQRTLETIRQELFLKDGRVFDYHSTPVFSPHGDYYGRICNFRDVSRQRWADDAVRESEERYGLLLEQSPDLVIVHVEGRILYANPATARTLGADRPEDLHDRSIFDFIHPDYLSTAPDRLPTLVAAGTHVLPLEQKFVRLDGTTVDVEVVATRIHYHGQAAIHLTARNVSNWKQTEELVKHMSRSDSLTGLPNRTLFLERLTHSISQARHRNRQVAVLCFDLDRFKVINDTLGHELGDRLLMAIAERLTACLRGSDTIARLSGDEFTVLIPDISGPQEAAKTAQHIHRSLSQAFLLDGHELFITVSIGITLFPDDGEDATFLLKNADTAMYRAKEQRNTYRLYTPAMNETALERLALESRMHKALERCEFLLHYQPQVDLKTGRIVGAEALIRWQHPEFGMVSPAKFIPLAEETGMILPITDWVLRTACEQARRWELAGSPIRVAVNLSGAFFRQPGLTQKVADVLAEVGVPAHLLDLELTESIFMEDHEATLTTLKALRAMGAHISIDDFGTGYSSLSYLKRFPIGMLKVDQSFVRDITVDPDDAAIAQTIILLGHSLNMRVIAEGVETAEQQAFLESKGCDEVQGYFISRPVPTEAFDQLLQIDRSKHQGS